MVDDEFDFGFALLSKIRQPFAIVFKRGRFKLVEGKYYPQHFGNEILTFNSKQFRLRFVLDRANVEVVISPPSPGAEWIDLQDILRLVADREISLEP